MTLRLRRLMTDDELPQRSQGHLSLKRSEIICHHLACMRVKPA